MRQMQLHPLAQIRNTGIDPAGRVIDLTPVSRDDLNFPVYPRMAVDHIASYPAAGRTSPHYGVMPTGPQDPSFR